MSTLTTPLYREQPQRQTEPNDVDRALTDLASGRDRWAKTSVAERIALAQACLDGIERQRDAWIKVACEAKGISPGTAAEGEEIAAGPMATVRYLQLLITTLRSIERAGKPQLPGQPTAMADGKLKVRVFPTPQLYDSLLFQGFTADVWLRPGITRENFEQHVAATYQGERPQPGIALVLGAGNVASIAPTDAFSKLFQEGKVVLLKMNPVNEYLGPIFAKAFAPLVEAGYLRFVYGGAEVGAHAVGHNLVDEVHITGSVYSHEAIVWGPPGPEREARKAQQRPLLAKRITSELGNVTPWIVVPGEYSEAELAFQAENVAATVTNNASFNCIATKMIVTSRSWPQRGRFLDLVDEVLRRVPLRKAYYPGAAERFRRFAGKEPGSVPPGCLPWTLRRDVDPARDEVMFNEESFVCVFGETALEAATASEFMQAAARFANEKLWGNLGAGVMVPRDLRRTPDGARRFEEFVGELRYGTVGINQWPAIGYALMCTPWGGYPDGTLEDPRSGIDWVHNTFMIDGIEKTVVEGPLKAWPKPFWFPTHRTADRLARKTLDLYLHPSVWKLPSLLLTALRG